MVPNTIKKVSGQVIRRKTSLNSRHTATLRPNALLRLALHMSAAVGRHNAIGRLFDD
jgi:hypothetical protein